MTAERTRRAVVIAACIVAAVLAGEHSGEFMWPSNELNVHVLQGEPDLGKSASATK